MRNVIVFFADQMRSDALGCHGNAQVRTPHIDWIARTGADLRRHTTPNQICSPSRGSFFSGLYPRHHRMYRNGVALPENLQLMSHHLQRAGFRTHGVGKFHFQPILAPADRRMPESLAFWQDAQSAQWRGPFYGFDTVDMVIGECNEVTHGGHYAAWLKQHHPDVVPLYQPAHALEPPAADLWEVWKSAVPKGLHYCTWIAERAASFITAAAAEPDPFFLFVSFPDPHHPFSPPAPYCYRHDPGAVPAPQITPGELERMPAYIRSAAHPDEHGFMLLTEAISPATIRTAIAHTYGLVEMIDDAVGTVLAALQRAGKLDDSLIIFTADHGEFLGDHGLLRKGPPPYRQLLEIPFLMHGPDLPKGITSERLTSHVDALPTVLDYLGLTVPQVDGASFLSALRQPASAPSSPAFGEFHPRAVPALYNHTIIDPDWRLTLYPKQPGWGELFDLRNDPGEHWNLYGMPGTAGIVDELTVQLHRRLPSQPDVDAEILGKY